LLAAGGFAGRSRGKAMKLNLDRIAAIRDAELIKDGDIYKRWAMNLILAALLDASFLGPKNEPRLNNNDVAKLAGERISESVIIRIIELYDGDYQTSGDELFRLRRKGVGDKTLKAIISKALELKRRNDD
jgi:hypothetical protein